MDMMVSQEMVWADLSRGESKRRARMQSKGMKGAKVQSKGRKTNNRMVRVHQPNERRKEGQDQVKHIENS